MPGGHELCTTLLMSVRLFSGVLLRNELGSSGFESQD
jgi:hypothetical protein